jgi:hypothetical protein
LIDGVIHMQLPREEPVLRIFARIQGSAELPVPGSGWEKALAAEEDGFAVHVWVEAPDVR